MPEPPVPLDTDDAADEEKSAALGGPAAEIVAGERALADDLPAMAASPPAAEPVPAQANGHREKRGGTLAAPSTLSSPAALFESLKLERTHDGGIRIDAPPEAAEQLMELFSGMARLLGELTAPTSRENAP
jgi:hypothetical protein